MGTKPIGPTTRGRIIERIEAAVEAGYLEWTDPDAYAGLMHVMFPEDFPALDPPLLPARNDRLAIIIRIPCASLSR